MPENPAPPPAGPTPAPTPTPDESKARTWNMLCHLSALAFFIVPFGSVLGPLLVWQIKKNEIPSVEVHGKASLNFQLTLLIVLIPSIFVTAILSAFCIGFLLVPLVIALALCGPIFAIIAGIKANDGKDYKYPYSFNLIK